jgi:hypothetical protein
MLLRCGSGVISLFTVLCLFGATRAMGGKLFPVLHGEPTPLQNALSRIKQSRLIDGYVWTYADLEVLVQLYPGPIDYRLEDSPAGVPPWKYPWVFGGQLQLYEPADVQKIIRESRFVLILREQDGKTCIVNALTGERIFKEGPDAQSASEIEIPCQEIWKQVPELDVVPEQARAEITELLKTPPAPPKFKRRQIPNVVEPTSKRAR